MLELPPSPKQKNKINIGYSKVNYKQDDICALWVKASSSEFNLMLEKKKPKKQYSYYYKKQLYLSPDEDREMRFKAPMKI